MRLFISINFDDSVKNSLCHAMEKLKSAGVEGRFPLRANLHLTLVFIGETNDVKSIRRVIDAVSAGPCSMRLSGLGAFKRQGGDIVWMGVEQNENLSHIQKQLSNGLSAAGFPIEAREYKPHLTLGRQMTYKAPVNLKELGGAIPPIDVEVSEVCLMKSEQIGGRLTYTGVYKKALTE